MIAVKIKYNSSVEKILSSKQIDVIRNWNVGDLQLVCTIKEANNRW